MPVSLLEARDSLNAIRADLNLRILGQPQGVDLFLLAWLGCEHVAFVGPPGEGKTFLAQTALEYSEGATHFYWLLNRYTSPDEVMGGLSIKSLKEDRYERVTTNKAPEAEVVILDEVFKANSATLNSLLGLMNERAVDGKPAALATMVGLSNEWPRGIGSDARQGDDDSLGALWDRFLFRYYWTSLDDDDLWLQVATGQLPSKSAASLSKEALELLRNQVGVVAAQPLSPRVTEALLSIRSELLIKGIRPSTRRWRKALRALAASAVLRGGSAVSMSDLMLLEHVLWEVPEQRDDVRAVLLQHGSEELGEALSNEAELAARFKEVRTMKEGPDKSSAMTQLLKDHLSVGKQIERSIRMVAADGEDTSDIEAVQARIAKATSKLQADLLGTFRK